MSAGEVPHEVSLVIPNWNGEEHLRDCLSSVRRQTVRPGQTILVDNGSTDGSLKLVENEYPWVSVITLPENAGFAAAVNKGIVATQSIFVALLNNDTELDPGWLTMLLDAIRVQPDIGSAGGKMLNFYDRDVIDGAGDMLTRGGSPYTRGLGEPDDGRYNSREYIFGVCAGAAVYRRELFEAVGLFDEDFISYYEDQDLAFRAQLAGFRSVYVPEAICYHKRGATGNKIHQYPIRMQERNLTAFYAKNFPWPTLMLRSHLILGSRIRRVYRAVRVGIGKPMLLGLMEGIRILPVMLSKRKKVQEMRKVPLSYLRSFMRKPKIP